MCPRCQRSSCLRFLPHAFCTNPVVQPKIPDLIRSRGPRLGHRKKCQQILHPALHWSSTTKISLPANIAGFPCQPTPPVGLLIQFFSALTNKPKNSSTSLHSVDTESGVSIWVHMQSFRYGCTCKARDWVHAQWSAQRALQQRKPKSPLKTVHNLL